MRCKACKGVGGFYISDKVRRTCMKCFGTGQQLAKVGKKKFARKLEKRLANNPIIERQMREILTKYGKI